MRMASKGQTTSTTGEDHVTADELVLTVNGAWLSTKCRSHCSTG